MADRLTESINAIVELTTRVDERVQLIMKQQKELEDKIRNQNEFVSDLNTKVKILEINAITDEIKEINEHLHKIDLRLQTLENSNNSNESRWKTIFGFAIQLIWVILAAFLLYKLGISAPAVP